MLLVKLLVGGPRERPSDPGAPPPPTAILPGTAPETDPVAAGEPALRTAIGTPAARPGDPSSLPPQGFAGRLVDRAGVPVAHATVYLLEARRDDMLTTLLVRQRGLSIPPVARTESDADGAFELRVQRLAPGGYEIHVLSSTHPDHTVPNLTGFEDQLVDVGAVRLPDSCTVAGAVTVLGNPGFPVADATITLRPAGMVPQFGTPPGREDGITTRTDAAGNFRFEHVAAGIVTVRAVAPGFAAVEHRAVEVSADTGLPTGLRFELPRGESIAGIVVDPSGVPIAGARVEQDPEVGPDGREVFLLGAGGSARAVADVLARRGARLTLCNRTIARAETLALDLAPAARILTLEEGLAQLARASVVINTLSLGHAGEAIRLPESAGGIFYDISYGKGAVAALAEARRKGWRALDGLGMLVAQASLSFELWFGAAPDLAAAHARARSLLEAVQ